MTDDTDPPEITQLSLDFRRALRPATPVGPDGRTVAWLERRPSGTFGPPVPVDTYDGSTVFQVLTSTPARISLDGNTVAMDAGSAKTVGRFQPFGRRRKERGDDRESRAVLAVRASTGGGSHRAW